MPSTNKTLTKRAIYLNKSSFDINSKFNKAVKYYQSGQLQKSEEFCKKILEISPPHSDSLHLLGLIALGVEKFDLAVDLIIKAIQNNPKIPVYYSNLGNVLQEQGRFNEANIYYKRALDLQPDYADVYYNMGNSYKGCHNLDEAISYYKKALRIQPDYVNAHYNMGCSLQEQGKINESISCYQKVIQFEPDHVDAHNNLGIAFNKRKKPDEAIICYRKAIQLKPDYVGAYVNIGNLFRDQSKLNEAISFYQKALQIKPSHGVEVKMSLLLPAISESKDSIKHYRSKLIVNLGLLISKGLTLNDPYREVGSVNFYLAYHGLNDKEIQRKTASFYINACPDLAWTSPGCDKQHKHEKIKIGIISKHFYSHTIGKLNHGIIKHLSREKFHVILCRFQGDKEDPLSKAINNAADEVVVLPEDLTFARQKIAEHAFDILFYTDIGMEPFTYFLAFSRLAPVQCVTWGHPVTTGIPNIDYFISSENAEPPGAEDHYTECLFRPKRLGIYFYRPELPKEISSRGKFDLPEDCKLYVCPQSLFKFHPDFDSILAKILRQDRNGILVLIEGNQKQFSKMLLQRFNKVFPDASARVKFLPSMPKDDFLSLLMLADAVLDTPFFGGGNTSLESFACGVPVVTLPGQFMRDRLTLALYKQMGIMDCVAKDAKSYVEIALRLANDKTWRDQIKKRITDRSDVLYEDIEAVHELEDFFEKAVGKVRKKVQNTISI